MVWNLDVNCSWNCNLHNYADCRSHAERELLGHTERELLGHAEREPVAVLEVPCFAHAEHDTSPTLSVSKTLDLGDYYVRTERGIIGPR